MKHLKAFEEVSWFKKRYAKKDIFLLIYNNNIEAIKKYIKYGGDINIRNELMWSPLIYAAYDQKIEIIKLLIDAGADEHITDKDGKTFYNYLRYRAKKMINQEYPTIGYELGKYKGSFKNFLKYKPAI